MIIVHRGTSWNKIEEFRRSRFSAKIARVRWPT